MLVIAYVAIGYAIGFLPAKYFKEGKQPVSEADFLDKWRYTPPGWARVRRSRLYWAIGVPVLLAVGFLSGHLRF